MFQRFSSVTKLVRIREHANARVFLCDVFREGCEATQTTATAGRTQAESDLQARPGKGGLQGRRMIHSFRPRHLPLSRCFRSVIRNEKVQATYDQSMSNLVVVEATSFLMERLLTSSTTSAVDPADPIRDADQDGQPLLDAYFRRGCRSSTPQVSILDEKTDREVSFWRVDG